MTGLFARRGPMARLGSSVVTMGPVVEPQGDWVDSAFGDDGYALLSWSGQDVDDVSMPLNTIALTTGLKYNYTTSEPNTNRRAMQPAAPNQAGTRRLGVWYGGTTIGNSVVATLTFTNAYTGMVRVFSSDWLSEGRRQTVKVDDGSNPAAVDLGGAFFDGMWVGRGVTVAAGGTVVVTATTSVAIAPAISGIFLDPS